MGCDKAAGRTEASGPHLRRPLPPSKTDRIGTNLSQSPEPVSTNTNNAGGQNRVRWLLKNVTSGMGGVSRGTTSGAVPRRRGR